MDDKLVIAGREFDSRLMVGTGRHRSNEEMVESIEASGADIITVAIRRLDLDNLEEKNILDYFDWNEYTILPNTAGMQDRRGGRLHRPPCTRGHRLGLDQAGGHTLLRISSARPARHLRGRQAANRRGIRGAAVHPRRPCPRQAA